MNDYEVVVAGLTRMLTPYANRVQIVELDSRMPVISPVDVLLYDAYSRAQIDESVEKVLQETKARVVLFTWNTDPKLVAECLRQGVAGVVSKTVDAERLVTALETVASGGDVDLPEAITKEISTGDWPGREVGLSARESEILALIAQGLSNQEIAARSYLSINSIKTYIRSAYRKIGVERRTQAVIWATNNGFTPDRARKLIDIRV